MSAETSGAGVGAIVGAGLDVDVEAVVDAGCTSVVGTGVGAGLGRECRGGGGRSPCFDGPEGAIERVAVQEVQVWQFLLPTSLAAECR